MTAAAENEPKKVGLPSRYKKVNINLYNNWLYYKDCRNNSYVDDGFMQKIVSKSICGNETKCA